MCFIYAQLSGLLPRLELHNEWAGARGDRGLPASM